MNNFSNILATLVFLSFSFSLEAQYREDKLFRIENSIKIFEEDSVVIKDSYPLHREKKYYFKLYECQRYIFTADNKLVFESTCPGDYIIRLDLGNYNYSSDTQIELSVDTLGRKGYNLDRLFVDRIDTVRNSSTQLAFKVYDLDKTNLGKILTIYYKKRPFFFRETKTLFLRHDDLNELVGKKIYLESFTVETMKDYGRQVYYVPINQAIKIEPKMYEVFLRKNWGRIKKIKNKLWLFFWDHIKQEYSREDELIFNYLKEY